MTCSRRGGTLVASSVLRDSSSDDDVVLVSGHSNGVKCLVGVGHVPEGEGQLMARRRALCTTSVNS